MSTTAEKIEVMQAFERGEVIQYNRGFGWEGRVICPSWNWEECDYQIAPKPKKTVDLYQWVCKVVNDYYVSYPMRYQPPHAIKRLDHTKMTIEVD